MQWYILFIHENDAQKRLDSFCKKIFPQANYGEFSQWLRKKILKVNNKKTNPQHRLEQADVLYVAEPLYQKLSSRAKQQLITKEEFELKYRDAQEAQEESKTIKTTENPLSAHPPSEQNRGLYIKKFINEEKIIFASKDIIALQKDAGERLFGAKSIANKLASLPNKSLSFTPAPSHRLDTGTSGLILCSLSVKGARTLQDVHQSEKLQKIYIALLENPTYHTQLEHRIFRDDTKKISHAFPIDTEKSYMKHSYKDLGVASLYVHSLDCLELSSPNRQNSIQKVYPSLIFLDGTGGKTHQIRVQCAKNKTALWGDTKYSSNKHLSYHERADYYANDFSDFFLHAGLLLYKSIELDNNEFPPALYSPLPKSWYQNIDKKDHYFLERLDTGLKEISRKWEETNFSDRNIDIRDFCISEFGGVMG